MQISTPTTVKQQDIRDSKLFYFLENLSAREWSRFRKFIESPYFNVNPQIIKLMDYLELLIKDPKHKSLSKEQIWDLIYNSAPYEDARLRKLFTDFLDLGEHFLAQEVFEENPLHQANYLMQAVHNRQLEKMYNSAASKARNMSAKQFFKPASFYYYQYEIEKNLYKLQNIEVNRGKKDNIEKINLSHSINNLDVFFISEKLRSYCSLLSWKGHINLDQEILFIDEIIKIAEDNYYSNFPQISIYLNLYYTFKNENDDQYYYNFKELIFKFIDIFPNEEAKEILDAALNYTVRKSNKGNLSFLKEMYNLYKFSITKEIIFINGELTPWSMKNIVTVALRLNEFEWTENFIQENSDRVNIKFRKNIINYNLANLYWHKKDFGKVLELVQELEFDEISYSLGAKLFVSSSYYELKELDVLSSFLESFRSFLQRNKNISGIKRDPYLEYIRFTKKLIDLQNADDSKILKFKETLSQSEVTAKKWLMDKVQQLLD